MSAAGLKRNINNNVVDATADRKWSPEVHTKIFIPPINITEPIAKFSKGMTILMRLCKTRESDNHHPDRLELPLVR